MGHSGSYGPQPGIESSPHSVEVQGLTTDGPGTTFSTPVSFGKHKMGFSTLMAFTGCNRQCKAGFYFYLFFIFLFIFIYFLVLPVYCYQPISLHPRAHMLSHLIPWTSASQTPLSVDFSRQEYWSGLPFPSPKAGF